MKKISFVLIGVVFLLSLVQSTSVLAQQDTMAPKKSAPKKSMVDCTAADDASITASVKQKLATTASLKDFTINVATSNGVVTLTGTVKTGLNKGTATRVTKATPCVKKVENQLTVEPVKKTSSGGMSSPDNVLRISRQTR